MNRNKLINELKNAYDVCPSQNKNLFLKTIQKQNVSTLDFVLSQIKYMRRSLIFRLVGFVLALLLIVIDSDDKQLLFLSIEIPFFALLIIYIIDSSRSYHMEELEMVTRFSLKMVLFSRLLISGIISFVLMFVASLITSRVKDIELLKVLDYFFVPYWTTIFMCLKLLRKYRDEGIKYCIGITCLISVAIALIDVLNIKLVLTNCISIAMLLTTSLLLINEIRNYLKNTEELLWNL